MARRINTRFLSLLLLTILGLGAGIFFVPRLLIQDRPETHMNLGNDATRESHWVEAANQYGQAGVLDPKNPTPFVKQGEALLQVARMTGNPGVQSQAEATLVEALEIDPNNLPALRDLLNLTSDRHDPVSYTHSIDYARRAKALAPDDATLAGAADVLILTRWFDNLSNDDDTVEQAFARLQKLQAVYPQDATIPAVVAQAMIKKGEELASQGDPTNPPPEAVADFQQANQVFKDIMAGTPTIPSQDRDPTMHYQYAVIATHLASSDHSSPDARKKWTDLASDQITRAQALVKPDNAAEFKRINVFAANLAANNGDTDRAEKILSGLREDIDIVLYRAQLMGNREDGRPDAEQLLQSTLSALQDDPSQIIFGSPRFALELALTKFHIVDYQVSTDPAERAQMQDQIQKSEDRLRRSAAGRQVLELDALEAQFLLARGDSVEAVNRLGKLVATSDEAQHNLEILGLLASAYQNTNQTSEAILTLEGMIKLDDFNVGARKRLVELLIQESPQLAQDQLRALAEHDPDDPDLYRYQIYLLAAIDAPANKAQIDDLYGKLPEANREELSNKVGIAITVQKWSDAIRILRLLIARDPQDSFNVYRLAQVLARQGNHDEAIKIVQTGLTAKPDNQPLKELLANLQGNTDIQNVVIQDPDKYEAQLELARLAGQRGTRDGMVESEAHLKAAAALKPESIEAWSALFQLYLQEKRFDEAAAILPKLGNGDNCDGNLYRFQLARARGDNATAIDIAAQLCRDRPDFANVWKSYGQVLEDSGDYDGAIQQYDIALQKRANDKDSLLGLIRCAVEQNPPKPDDQFQYIKEALRRIPGDPDFVGYFLQHQLQTQDFNGALQTLNDFIARNPDDPDLEVKLADIYLQTALFYKSRNHPENFKNLVDQAESVLIEANKRWPDNISIYDELAHVDDARSDPAAMIADYQRLAARPAWKDRPEPYSGLAQVYGRCGIFPKAEENIRLALANSDDAIEYQEIAAAIFNAQKKPDAWDEALEILRVKHADDPEIRLQILGILLNAGRLDSAQVELNKYLADNKSDKINLLIFWANYLSGRHQYAQAIDYANQALAIDATNLNALNIRGDARLHSTPPDPSGALDDLLKVERSAPNHAPIRQDLGEAYLSLGRLDDAVNEMNAALALAPDNRDLRLKLVTALRDPRHPRPDEAYQLLHTVDGFAPFSADAGVFTAEAEILLIDLHRTDDAVAASNTAVQLDPTRLDAVRINLQALLADSDYANALTRLGTIPDASRQTDWALLDLGLAQQGLSDNKAALDDWRACLNAAKSDPDSNQTASIVRSIAKSASLISKDDALALLLPHASDSVAVRLALAQIYADKSDPDSAGKILDDLVKQWNSMSSSDQLAVAQAAANLYMARPHPQAQKAQDVLQRWLTLQPDNMDALTALAVVLADDFVPSRAKEGLAYAQRAVQTMNNKDVFVPKCLDTQGWLLILSGNPGQGVDILSDLAQSSATPTIYMHLSEGYLHLSNPNPNEAYHEAQLGLAMLQNQGNSSEPELAAHLQSIMDRSQALLKNQHP